MREPRWGTLLLHYFDQRSLGQQFARNYLTPRHIQHRSYGQRMNGTSRYQCLEYRVEEHIGQGPEDEIGAVGLRDVVQVDSVRHTPS